MQTRFRLVAGAFVSMLVGMSIGYLFWGRRGYSPAQETMAKAKKRRHAPDTGSAGSKGSSKSSTSEAAQSPVEKPLSACDEGLRLSKKACAAGQTLACKTVLNIAPENLPEKKQALLSLLSQCKAAKPSACETVMMHLYTQNTSPDYKEADQAGWRQCQASNLEACKETLEDGSSRSKEARKRLENICLTTQGSKQTQACKYIASSDIPGRSPSEDRARNILKKKCQAKEAEACEFFLQVVFDLNHDVYPESELAGTITQDLCEANNASACEMLSLSRYVEKGFVLPEEMKNLKKRCDSNEFKSCEIFFRFAKYDSKLQDELSDQIAKMCHTGRAQACESDLSVPREVNAENLKRALSEVNKTCEAGDMHACEVLGSMFVTMCEQFKEPFTHHPSL